MGGRPAARLSSPKPGPWPVLWPGIFRTKAAFGGSDISVPGGKNSVRGLICRLGSSWGVTGDTPARVHTETVTGKSMLKVSCSGGSTYGDRGTGRQQSLLELASVS